MVILDTNIVIDHLRQNKREETVLSKLAREKPKETLAISIISIQELYGGKSTKIQKRETDLLATIAPLKILPYTFEVAQLGGKIARDKQQAIELADATIAATAIINNTQLLTLNERHFKDIKNIEFFKI